MSCSFNDRGFNELQRILTLVETHNGVVATLIVHRYARHLMVGLEQRL